MWRPLAPAPTSQLELLWYRVAYEVCLPVLRTLSAGLIGVLSYDIFTFVAARKFGYCRQIPPTVTGRPRLRTRRSGYVARTSVWAPEEGGTVGPLCAYHHSFLSSPIHVLSPKFPPRAAARGSATCT